MYDPDIDGHQELSGIIELMGPGERAGIHRGDRLCVLSAYRRWKPWSPLVRPAA
jgi:hypothetical protein